MLTVLIVEDEPAIRKMLRTSLTTKGYKIVEAKIGNAAFFDPEIEK